jgi:hypothetical protein
LTFFGGVNPSNWTDGNLTACNISSDKATLRTLFTHKGYAKANATLWNHVNFMYSSTNSEVFVALFRVRNYTGAAITWIPYFYFSAFTGWGQNAGVMSNGVCQWTGPNTTSTAFGISIPPNQISTVIFNVNGGYPCNLPGVNGYYQITTLIFYNNSLALPAGLEFIDDLDTAIGTTWGQ